MNKEDLVRIIGSFAGKRIMVVGDVMLDEYLYGDVYRISPEAPVPVMELRQSSYVPGGVGNVAANINNLGGQALLSALIGHDLNGDRLRSTLQAFGVELAGIIVDDNRPTTTKTRIIAHSQQIVRIDVEQVEPLAQDLQERMLEWISSAVKEVDACLLSDYAKGVLSPAVTKHVIACARQFQKPVVVGPKGADFLKYSGATVIIPNEQEAQLACNGFGYYGSDLHKVAEHLQANLPDSSLVITEGARGMTVFQHGEEPIRIPTTARHVYDVVGAGDTVVSTVVLGLASGASLIQASYLANIAAGLVIGKSGTSTTNCKELLMALASRI